jgi:hypothetical protein
LGSLPSGDSKKAVYTTGQKYAMLRTPETSKAAVKTIAPPETVPTSRKYLETKPAKSGMPAIPREATAKAAIVRGIRRPIPAMFEMSSVWVSTWTAPAQKNRVSFMNA